MQSGLLHRAGQTANANKYAGASLLPVKTGLLAFRSTVWKITTGSASDSHASAVGGLLRAAGRLACLCL